MEVISVNEIHNVCRVKITKNTNFTDYVSAKIDKCIAIVEDSFFTGCQGVKPLSLRKINDSFLEVIGIGDLHLVNSYGYFTCLELKGAGVLVKKENLAACLGNFKVEDTGDFFKIFGRCLVVLTTEESEESLVKVSLAGFGYYKADRIVLLQDTVEISKFSDNLVALHGNGKVWCSTE